MYRVEVKKIQNTDKFRPAAVNFEKYGNYTTAPKGTTAFYDYWDQETERCLKGYSTEDGDHISGYFYFYLNYCQIVEVVIDPITNKAEGIKGFPRFWDYDKAFFDVVDEAERLGKHLAVLKARRKGYSYKIASMLCRNFYLIPSSKSYAYAAENEFLTKDGILTKSWEYMDFIDEHTAWYKKRQKVDTKMHKRASAVIDREGVKVEIGYKSEIIGVTLKNDVNKVRGKCFSEGTKVLMYNGNLKNIEDIKLGDRVMGPDGTSRTVRSLHTGFDNMYRIMPTNGDIQIVNSSHDIYCKKVNNKRQNPTEILITAPEFLKKSNNIQQQYRLEKTGVEFRYKSTPIDPYFIGLWLGDGSIGKTEITTEDKEIIEYLKKLADDLGCKYHQYPKKNNPNVVQAYLHSGDSGIRRNKVKNILIDLGIFRNKIIPDIYLINDKYNRLKLLAGLIDTDGYYDRQNGRVEIIQKRKELAEQIVFLSRSLGFKTTINRKFIDGYGDFWRINILSGLEEIPTLLPRKQAVKTIKPFVKNPLHTTFKVEEYGLGRYYGFTVDKDNLFLLGDFTISHNSGRLIIYEEAGKFPHLKTAWQIARPSLEQGSSVHGLQIAFGCVCAGTKVWNNEGNLVSIEDLTQEEGVIGYNTFCSEQQEIESFRKPYETNCYKITTNSGRELKCSYDHPILYSKQHMSRDIPGMRQGNKRFKMKSWGWKQAEDIKVGYQVGVSDEVPFFGKTSMWNPRLIGWLIGDGTYGKDKTPRLANCDDEINAYIEKNFNTALEKSYTTKGGKLYKETRIKDICFRLRELGIYGQVKNEKRIPQLIYKCSKEDVCEFIGGLFDTDGYIKDLKSKKSPPRINITSSCKEMLIEILHLLQKLGIHGKINTIKASNRTRTYKGKTIKDSNTYYRLSIGDVKSLYIFANTIKLYPKHKQERLEKYKSILEEYSSEISKYIHGIRFEKVKSIENIGVQTVYNLTASTNHTYIANGIITHNTGGSMDSDFEGLKDIFYEPDAYNCLPIENIWDEGAIEPCGFYVPDYYNFGEEYMDKDGNSNVKGAIKYGLIERDKIVKSSSDRTSIDRYIAEHSFTPMEASLQISTNIFPKAELIKHLSFIRTNKSVQSFKQVGKLVVDEYGILKWEQSARPKDLTKYRLDPSMDSSGEIVIWEHPVENPPHGLYIASCDSYDFDQSGSGSLGSVFIYKRFQKFESFYDILVAEYTGRPEKAEMFYENVKKLLMYYNARLLFENQNPGILTYFRNNKVDYLLADQPDIIDKIIKNSTVHRAKGIHMTKEISLFAEGLIRDWLITVRSDGKMNLHTILSEPFLEELIAYNDKGNFDRVSSFKILMLYKEDLFNTKVNEKRDSNRTNILFEQGIYRDYDYTDIFMKQPTIN